MQCVKERPILFAGPMVRAILDGSKTQTRRIVKPQPPDSDFDIDYFHRSLIDKDGKEYPECKVSYGIWGNTGSWSINCPYGSRGDRLYVRETWCQQYDDGRPVYNLEGNLDPSCCWYRADGADVSCDDGDGGTAWNKDGTQKSPWSPSIHMPRWASRITLEIEAIRVERLNDISEADAIAEGITDRGVSWIDEIPSNPNQVLFSQLWERINGKNSWAENPFVWVIEFRRV